MGKLSDFVNDVMDFATSGFKQSNLSSVNTSLGTGFSESRNKNIENDVRVQKSCTSCRVIATVTSLSGGSMVAFYTITYGRQLAGLRRKALMIFGTLISSSLFSLAAVQALNLKVFPYTKKDKVKND